MPAEMMEVEVFVIVDENGDYSVGADGDTAAERYSEDVGANDATCKRVVKLVLSIPTPAEVLIRATVPAESNEGTAVVCTVGT